MFVLWPIGSLLWTSTGWPTRAANTGRRNSQFFWSKTSGVSAAAVLTRLVFLANTTTFAKPLLEGSTSSERSSSFMPPIEQTSVSLSTTRALGWAGVPANVKRPLSVPQPVPVAAASCSVPPEEDAVTSVARTRPAASASAPGATTRLGPQPTQDNTPQTIVAAKTCFIFAYF